MRSTTPNLLSRVRNPGDHDAWREFDGRYREMLVRFCRRRGVPLADAEDLVQRVFLSLAQSLPQFVYDPARGRFRDYLFRSMRNSISAWAARPNRDWQPLVLDGDRRNGELANLPGADEESRIWEEEWVAHHYRLAMATIGDTFDAKSVDVFNRALAGESVENLCARFSLTADAIYKLRTRIRRRMEELIAEQIREEEDVDGDGRR